MKINKQLQRLNRLQGSDPGIFALAVHAFIEGELRRRYDLPYDVQPSFRSVSDMMVEELGPPARSFFTKYTSIRDEANDVRHTFKELSVDQALIASIHLLTFCTLIDESSHSVLQEITRTYDEIWERSETKGELLAQARNLQKKNKELLTKEDSLSDQLAELQTREAELTRLKELLRLNEGKIGRLSKSAEDNEAKNKELRKERYELQEQLRALDKKSSSLQEYIEALRSLTFYTRTRRDYERLIMRLSPEQEAALSHIDLDEDFLITGGPGTGKTLVLLKAIEKRTEGSRVALLTFTNSLAKYGQYLARLLTDSLDSIMTVHHFLLERINEAQEGYTPLLDVSELVELCAQYESEAITRSEIYEEIVTVFWDRGFSYEAYCIEGLPRAGLARDYPIPTRIQIWEARVVVEDYIEATKRLPFAYFPIKALELVERCEPFDHLFIDEAQDLTIMALKALKRFARRSIVLAGDGEQAIYQPGFSFVQTGVDVVDRTVLLQENFRSTLQIHELAQRFEKRSEGEGAVALRDGAAPELYQRKNPSALLSSLVERITLFTEYLEYEAENLCIMCPSSSCYSEIEKALQAIGKRCVRINDSEFSFDSSSDGAIRLSTLHSAKGLDVAVVFIYLPFLPKTKASYEEAVNDELIRKLLYVAMTRAIDHLTIYTLQNPQEPVIRRLVGAFKGDTSVK